MRKYHCIKDQVAEYQQLLNCALFASDPFFQRLQLVLDHDDRFPVTYFIEQRHSSLCRPSYIYWWAGTRLSPTGERPAWQDFT
jgi:hypothetical protein